MENAEIRPLKQSQVNGFETVLLYLYYVLLISLLVCDDVTELCFFNDYQ